MLFCFNSWNQSVTEIWCSILWILQDMTQATDICISDSLSYYKLRGAFELRCKGAAPALASWPNPFLRICNACDHSWAWISRFVFYIKFHMIQVFWDCCCERFHRIVGSNGFIFLNHIVAYIIKNPFLWSTTL